MVERNELKRHLNSDIFSAEEAWMEDNFSASDHAITTFKPERTLPPRRPLTCCNFR